MMSGQCNCGAVAFELTAQPWGVFVCHCSICRRFTGTHGNAVVIIANENFRWLRGQANVASWVKPGHDWQGWFCRTCGSQLPGVNDDARMFVPAGLIGEGGDDLRVIHHIWVDSRASWDEIADAGLQHGQGFDGD